MINLNYGIVGNGKSAALISKSGSTEWLCLPVFDSASVFASLLDKKKGGSFEILVDENYSINQRYLPKTNILVTKFSNGTDTFEVIDFMPRYHYKNGGDHLYSPSDFIRYFKWKQENQNSELNIIPNLSTLKNQLKRKFIQNI